MLESNVIQYRGFHNIVEDGKVTGFQLCIRSDYYRGVWLSQLRPGKVVVDGVTYPKESVIWQITVPGDCSCNMVIRRKIPTGV